MNSLREAVKAGEEGSRSNLHKSFYTNVPSECLDDMERSAAEKMGLEFDSSKEHYHVKVCASGSMSITMFWVYSWVADWVMFGLGICGM